MTDATSHRAATLAAFQKMVDRLATMPPSVCEIRVRPGELPVIDGKPMVKTERSRSILHDPALLLGIPIVEDADVLPNVTIAVFSDGTRKEFW